MPSELTYAEAVDHLYALGQELAPLPPLPDGSPAPRRKFDLAHMRSLCAALGDPQLRFPSILIAGTNGKGSTAATLASILTAAGHRTALYTSPHLIRVNERIQISGVPIADHDFARLYATVMDEANALVAAGTLPQSPSFFEILTALAFLYFAGQQVEIAVLEVGLGGRLDATNIVSPTLSILTDIALDHQEYLGDTIAAITREKCGILRPGGTLITLPQHPEANQAIGEAAASLDLHAINAAAFIPTRTAEQLSTAIGRNQYTLSLEGQPLQVDSPLPGQHQQRNLALAIAASVELSSTLSGSTRDHKARLPITISDIEAGIRETHWPGRLELLSLGVAKSSTGGANELLLDVAHNPAGAWTLRAALAQLPEDRPRTLIFSCLRDKNLTEISRILFPLFDSSPGGERPHDHIILAPIANPRAADVEELLKAAQALDVPAHAAPHLDAALAQARAITPAGGLIVATGSVYLVGELSRMAAAE